MTQHAVPDDLQTLVRKPRWTADDAQRVLAAIGPLETQRDFGARMGVDPARLSRWKSKLPPAPRPARGREPAERRADPQPTFAHVATLTLGRRPPLAVVELIAEQVRFEFHDLEHGEACLISALRALAAVGLE